MLKSHMLSFHSYRFLLQHANICNYSITSLVSKTEFIENYLTRELDNFRKKHFPSSAIQRKYNEFPFSIHSQVEVEILDLINSGSVGIGILDRERSWLIMVPLALPGERVLARITANGPGISTSKMLSLISSPSAVRRKPECEHFSQCNTCNLQHINYEEQLSLKTETVRSTFSQILDPKTLTDVLGKVEPSPLQYGFRNKMTPHYNRPLTPHIGQVSNIGFNDADGSVVDIKSCKIVDPNINLAFQKIREKLHNKWKTSETNGVGATMLFRRRVFQYPEDQDNMLMDDCSSIREHVDVVFGNGANIICSEVIDGIKFNYAACDFFQTNPRALFLCIQFIRKKLKQKYSHLTHLLDGYCGVGLFAILLQSQFTKIVGIETNERSVQLALLNAKNLPGEDRTTSKLLPLRFLKGNVENWLANPKLLSFLPATESVVLLDPPRAGLSDSLVECLVKYQPSLIIYISCYPLTQAADISKLLSCYKVTIIQPFDFFPQSHHVENVVFLEKI